MNSELLEIRLSRLEEKLGIRKIEKVTIQQVIDKANGVFNVRNIQKGETPHQILRKYFEEQKQRRNNNSV